MYNIVVYLLGDIFNQFAEWVLWDNNTGLYYETWTVRDKPGMFLIFICYSEKLINICGKNYKLVYVLVHIFKCFFAGFFNEKFRLIDWRWSVWRAGGRPPQLG